MDKSQNLDRFDSITGLVLYNMQDPKESCNETRKTHTNANEMPPGAYNDLANIAAWLEKFSEQAVVTRVNLVGNLVGCLSHIGEVDEDRSF